MKFIFHREKDAGLGVEHQSPGTDNIYMLNSLSSLHLSMSNKIHAKKPRYTNSYLRTSLISILLLGVFLEET